MKHPEWALVIGGASCVWDDVLAWEALYGRQWDGLVIAANDIGAHWPRELHHWVSLHPAKFERWQALRQQQNPGSSAPQTWANKKRLVEPQVTDRLVEPWAGGSSGMFAVQVAQVLGCRRAVLCGIPMTATPHFQETTERFHEQWLAAAGHWKAWTRCRDRMQGWARSMSGRTAELLGTPSLDWLLAE